MQGNEKLLAARARIEDVLREYDIAAHVVLHMPGFIEVLNRYDPSYSCLTPMAEGQGAVGFRLRSKLEDYHGDKDAQRRDLEATANMVSMLGEALARNAFMMVELGGFIDRAVKADHTELRRLPDEPRGPTQ